MSSEHDRSDPEVANEPTEVGPEDDIADAEVVETVDAKDAELAQVLEDAQRSVLEERDEYLDQLRRLQAEFDNYRKRTMRHQTEVLERSTETLLTRLLPVLDALDLALAHAKSPEDGDSTVQALVAISSLLNDVLAKEGLERIDAAGIAFDPTIHDAVAHEAREATSEDAEEGAHQSRVVEVLRAGYQLKGKVIRPAMVKVES
jgi:molecular chaperone GrpE